MIYVMYEYSTGVVQAFRDDVLEFQKECTTAEAEDEIRNKYGIEVTFLPLTVE